MHLLLLAGLALAQDAPDIHVNAQYLRPTPNGPLIAVEDSELGDAPFGGRGLLQYATPLVLAYWGETRVGYVNALFEADPVGYVNVGGFRFDAHLPLVLWRAGEVGGGRVGLGDARLRVRTQLVDGDSGPFGVAAATGVILPTSTLSQGLAGGAAWVVDLAADRQFGATRLVANAGLELRGVSTLGERVVGGALPVGLGSSWQLAQGWGLGLESTARLPVKQLDGWRAVPIELLASASRQVSDRAALRVGLGTGLTDAVGSPALRLVIGVEPVRAVADPDDDGIPEPFDRCPYEAETVNDIRDQDGCPEDERVLGFEASSRDEGAGFKAWADSDGDGIGNALDACPDAAEDVDDFEDDDGCPEVDNDHDGILDDVDQCPLRAETMNAYSDEDGCPEFVPEALADISGVVRGITFATNSAVLRTSSRPILEKVLAALRADPTLRLAVEGHTDNAGQEGHNQLLSLRRSKAIRAWLAERGIAEERIDVAGYGPSRPVASNDTSAGRAENRRVELLYETDQEAK